MVTRLSDAQREILLRLVEGRTLVKGRSAGGYWFREDGQTVPGQAASGLLARGLIEMRPPTWPHNHVIVITDAGRAALKVAPVSAVPAGTTE